MIIAAFTWPHQVGWLLSRQVNDAEHTRQLGGELVRAALRNPERAEAVLLKPASEYPTGEPHDFVAASDPQFIDSAVAADIGQILNTRSLFPAPAGAKACIPNYGVRLSFYSGNDRVDIYLCFECAILVIELNDKSPIGLNFDYAYHRLITAVCKIFPDNDRLAKLAQKRRG